MDLLKDGSGLRRDRLGHLGEARRVTRCDARGATPNPLHQAREHIAGAELDEKLHTVLAQRLHRLGPPDAARDLGAELLLDGRGVIENSRRRVESLRILPRGWAAVAISGEWNAPWTARETARFAPRVFAASVTALTASGSPEMTTCPLALMFARATVP